MNEEGYKMLFDSMLDGFALHEIICDEAGKPIDYRFLEVNPTFEKMTGLKSEDIIGKTVLEVLPGTEKYWIDTYGEVALTGIPKRFENYSKAINKYYDVSAFSPKKNQFAVFTIDVTEKKEHENAAIKSKLMLQNIIDLLPNRIFWKNKELQYLGCNLAFAKDAGKNSIEEVIGKTDFEMAWKAQADSFRKDDTDVINSGEAKLNYEEPITTSFGDIQWITTNKVVLKDLDGNIIGILGSYFDITERKLAEEQAQSSLNETQKMLKITTNRELKMIELKTVISELESRIADLEKKI